MSKVYYYVDSVSGSDSNDGLTSTTPKEHISAILNTYVYDSVTRGILQNDVEIVLNGSLTSPYVYSEVGEAESYAVHQGRLILSGISFPGDDTQSYLAISASIGWVLFDYTKYSKGINPWSTSESTDLPFDVEGVRPCRIAGVDVKNTCGRIDFRGIDFRPTSDTEATIGVKVSELSRSLAALCSSQQWGSVGWAVAKGSQLVIENCLSKDNSVDLLAAYNANADIVGDCHFQDFLNTGVMVMLNSLVTFAPFDQHERLRTITFESTDFRPATAIFATQNSSVVITELPPFVSTPAMVLIKGSTGMVVNQNLIGVKLASKSLFYGALHCGMSGILAGHHYVLASGEDCTVTGRPVGYTVSSTDS